MKKLVSIIIPAYNEERNIKKVIREVKKLKRQIKLEIIVVDDGSSDLTVKIAKKERAKIFSNPQNLGKGRAVQLGLEKARGDYIIQIDSDGQFLPKEIPKFLEKLSAGADMVLGSRFKQKGHDQRNVSGLYLLGNHFLSILTSLFSGVRVTDVMAGYKGFRQELAKRLSISTNHFGYEAEIIVKAAKLGYQIEEVSIGYKKRIHGSSSVKPSRDGLLVVWTILKTYLQFKDEKKKKQKSDYL